jgi:quinol monooxygenase YgiN
MLIVVAEIGVDAGAVDGVRDALRTMETETLEEPGCHTYAFSIDVSDPTTMRIIERWESEEALAAHFKTSHMAAFRAAIAQIKLTSMSVTVYEVAREVPLPR